MSRFNSYRRRLLQAFDASATLALPGAALAAPAKGKKLRRVVVIDGGMAGATVAKYLRLWGGTGVSVTLVERVTTYASNILSNLVLNGQRTMTSLQFGYSNLATRYGIRLVKGDVAAIDSVGHSVSLADGSKLPYDRLVVAPGTNEGVFYALDAVSGRPLWHFQTGAMIYANPVAFAVEGRQYLAIAAGSTLQVFALAGSAMPR